MYAKINESSVVKFPYSIVDMEQDNPGLVVVKCEDFPAFYASTEAAKNGSNVVSVSVDEFPAIDNLTQKAVLNIAPTLIDGKWILKFNVRYMTEEEISVAQQMKAEGTIQ